MINKKTSAIIVIATIVILGLLILAINLGNNKNEKFPGNNDRTDHQANEKKDAGESKNGSKPEDSETKDNNDENNEIEGKDNDAKNNENENSGVSSNQKRDIKPVKARALYLSGTSAGKKQVIDKVIELAKTTELNAVVIDVKEAGIVNYISEVPEVKKNSLCTDYYDPVSLVKKLHDNDIYVIGRVVCFLDNGLGTKRADLTIKKTDGSPWKEGKWGTWVNPYNEEVRRYNIDIAKEAVEKGFDEIQFDYVRFPSGTGKKVDYGANVPSKADVIGKFLETAKRELHDERGVYVSADVFGIICLDPNTKNSIGQDLERVGSHIDYICPMVYPSHYANASKNHYSGNGQGQNINGILFAAPDLEPYKVVYNTLKVAKDRISKVDGYTAKVRPYLQSFTAKYLPSGYYQSYGAEEIRQQIKAVYDAGYEEWILWSSGNIYPDGAFEKKTNP